MSPYKKTLNLIKSRINKLDAIEQKLKPDMMKMSKLNMEVIDLKEILLVELEEEGISKVSYAGFDLRLSSREIPTVKDFDALCKYVLKTKKFELFTRALNTTGFKELFKKEDGSWSKKFPAWADIYIKKDVSVKRSK